MIEITLGQEKFQKKVLIENEHRCLTIFFSVSKPVAFLLENLPRNTCYVAHTLQKGIRSMPADYDFQLSNEADFRDKLRYALRVVVSNG